MKKILAINEGWHFLQLESPAQTPPALPPKNMQPVDLPHIWNREQPAASGCCLYQKEFAWDGGHKHLFLAFDAVCGVARVFLNGVFLGEHRGSYSRFVLDATEVVRPGNLLQVLADNTRVEDVNPLQGDFTYWGGISRGVSLIAADEAHFDLLHHGALGLEILQAGADGVLHVNARVCGGTGGSVEYTVEDDRGDVQARCLRPADAPEAAISLPNPRLWQGQADPYLYRCTARLRLGEEICDEISLPFGFRSAAIDPEKGFLLNGQPLRLHGVARHNDCESGGGAPSEQQIQEDFALIREIGANAVRLSHYQHPQAVYDLCDQQGLVVWAEIPMLSMPQGNEGVVENACSQLTELILQNRHHPSICLWGVQNEIAMMGESLEMYANVKKLNALAHQLDSTRPTTSANLYSVKNASQLNFITDAVGYNIYFGWYYGEMKDYGEFFRKFHADNPSVPLCVSEYGVDCNPAYHSEAPECKDYTEEFQCLFHENAYAAIRADKQLWGSFVWNMFDFSSAIRDEGGIKARNCKGLVSYDRTLKKDAFYYYKACWSSEPFVHIAGRRFADRCGETTTIKVYSNQPRVSLRVNGQLFSILDGKTTFAFKHVPLSEHTLIEAFAGSLLDRISLCRVAQPNPAYTYPKKGQGNRVTNWFRQQKAQVELFPEGRYSISDKIGDLLANPETAAILERELPAIVNNPRARSMGGMTLLRILDYNAESVSQQQALDVNALLNQIQKPEGAAE